MMSELTQHVNSQTSDNFPPEMLRRFEALFEFYDANGVDVILAESPQDRLVETIRMQTFVAKDSDKKPTLTKPSTSISKPTQTISKKVDDHVIHHEKYVKQVTQIANEADSIEKLTAELRKVQIGNQNAMLSSPQFLFGAGPLNPRLMLVGDCPNRDDAAANQFFVGESGRLLDAMLGSIGLIRDEVYLSNFIPRQVLPAAIPQRRLEVCEPFIKKLIELVNPELLITFGSEVTKYLLGDETGIAKLNGEIRDYRMGERKIPSLILNHPKYLIHAPIGKKNAWRGLLGLQELLEQSKS